MDGEGERIKIMKHKFAVKSSIKLDNGDILTLTRRGELTEKQFEYWKNLRRKQNEFRAD